MKTRIIKSLLTFMFMFVALPMMSQDYMIIHFKNGDFRKFYMKNITEITTSKVDADGVQHSDYNYQQITTIYDKYIYNIEDVDSITYTKIDEELAEHNFVTAMPIVFNTISECETIDDVEQKIDVIKNAEGVADAWSDGHQLFVAIAQDEVYSFHFSHDKNVYSDGYENTVNQVKAMLPQLKTAIKKDGSQLKVVIANQAHKDESRYGWLWNSYLDPLIKEMESCDIRVDYVPEPTIDFFYDHCKNPDTADHLNLYDYDVIFLLTHGSYYNVKLYMYNTQQVVESGIKWHSFITSDDIITVNQSELPSWEDYYYTFRNWRDESSYKDVTDANINFWFQDEKRNDQTVWVAHPALTETFFRFIVQDETSFYNPNSVFFNLACQSLMGEKDDTPSFKLAEEFTKRGLGSYIGYDESNGVGQSAGYHLFINMLNGMSLKKAFDNLSDGEKHEKRSRNSVEYFADLSIYPENNADIQSLFLLPVHTEEISNEAANAEYNQNKTVRISGGATLINYGNVEYSDKTVELGFEITYYDPVTNTRRIKAETEPISYSNKVEFYAYLDNLEPNRTYYYRAYTYDGLNYNYGAPCSFKIEKNADGPIPTDGLVAYYPFNGNANDESGNGNHGVLSGNNVPALTTDRFGNTNSAYDFGGYRNYNWIKVPNSESLKFSKEWTMSFWIQQSEFAGMDGWGRYSTTGPGFAAICKAGDGNATYPGLHIMTGKGQDGKGINVSTNNSNGNSHYQGNWNHSMGYSKSDYQLGDWLHITVVVKNTDKILYLNGEEVARDGLNKEANFTSMNAQDLYIGIMASSNMTLGRYGSGAWYPFYGKIDDIRIYNKALNSSEIKTLYHETNGE